MNTVMNTIPAQEIKQRGISAVDELLARGPVHVIMRNRPRYVIMDEQEYVDLLEARAEAHRAHLRASLEDVKAGRVGYYETTDELMAAIHNAREDEE